MLPLPDKVAWQMAEGHLLDQQQQHPYDDQRYRQYVLIHSHLRELV